MKYFSLIIISYLSAGVIIALIRARSLFLEKVKDANDKSGKPLPVYKTLSGFLIPMTATIPLWPFYLYYRYDKYKHRHRGSAWNYGEQVPDSEPTGNVRRCVKV
jgi:hypothetical protein